MRLRQRLALSAAVLVAGLFGACSGTPFAGTWFDYFNDSGSRMSLLADFVLQGQTEPQPATGGETIDIEPGRRQRFRIQENDSALPVDRVILSYNYFNNTGGQTSFQTQIERRIEPDTLASFRFLPDGRIEHDGVVFEPN